MSRGTTTTSSPSGTPSPTTDSSSTSSSPGPLCLDPSIMNSQAESSQSARSTPSHSSVDLPRTLAASKGGCWTCRLRRKKCDEQREGDTCQTCKRLTIKCLGWGAKRPDWMRDKRAVDEYKAGIKEQLNRAGLIRGQPRPNLLGRNAPSRASASTRPAMRHRVPVAEATPSTSSSLGLLPNSNHGEVPSFFPGAIFNPGESYGYPEVPGASSPIFDMFGYGVSMDSHNDMGMMGPMYPPEPHLPSLSNHMPSYESLPDFTSFPGEGYSENPVPQYPSPSQQTVNVDQIVFEFNQARNVLFRFDAYGAVSHITYNLIKQDPTSAVTKVVRALGQLHQKRMRVSRGMEADTKPEHSPAVYYCNEALMQLKSNKDLQRRLNESDAVTAFYIILFSQLGGCIVDWDEPFAILCEWLVQTGLPGTEEPWLFFQGMTAAGRLAVKGALWVDIFTSVMTGRSPKFFLLWRRLLGERGTYWDQNSMPFQRGLRMDTLMGCPDEALLMIAEVSVLAQWKAAAQRDGTLSYRELIRRGDVIEQRLKQNVTDTRLINDINLKLIPNEIVADPDVTFPGEDARAMVADLFREAAVLQLHTVLSGPCPGVPEIAKCVRNITQLLSHSPPTDVERGLVLPIALAGCMTNDSAQREFLRGRFQVQNESIGNLMQARLLMELLWQKRDVNVVPGGVSLPETVQEKNLRLLLI